MAPKGNAVKYFIPDAIENSHIKNSYNNAHDTKHAAEYQLVRIVKL